MIVLEIYERKMSMLFFRGDVDRYQVENFDAERRYVFNLMGPSLYLTSNIEVASDFAMSDYTERQMELNKEDKVVKNNKEMERMILKQIIMNELHMYNQIKKEMFNELSKSEKEELLREMVADYYEKAKKILKSEDVILYKRTSGEIINVKKDYGFISSFEIPDDQNFLRADEPLSDDDLFIVRRIVTKNVGVDGILDMRDEDGKFCSFDEYVEKFKEFGTWHMWESSKKGRKARIGGEGKNPSFFDLYLGTVSCGTVIGKDDNMITLHKELSENGYIGWIYGGGVKKNGYVKGGGGVFHDVIGLWFNDDVKNFFVKTEKVSFGKHVKMGKSKICEDVDEIRYF